MIFRRLLPRARALRTEVWAIALAARDPRTPWAARALGWIAVAYALSPIDLVPDFIPVLGQLDDLVLVPAAFALVLRLVPPQVMRECREKAAIQTARVKRAAWIAAGVIVALWLLSLWAIYLLLRALFRTHG
ncbi:MAG: YkvA family protein [Candidatus Eisenbacteria bacterium]